MQLTEAPMLKTAHTSRRSNAARNAAAVALMLVAPAIASAQAGSYSGHSTNTIVDVATKAGSFNTLLAAVKAAGLVETLQGEGPFTVFAPTDAAFAKLPK